MSIQKQAQDYSRASLPSLLWGLQRRKNILHLSPTPDSMAPSHLFLWRASLGWSVAILAGFADTSRGRDRDLGRDTKLPTILSTTLPFPPSYLPSQAGYLGQLPLNRGVLWIVEIWLPMLVLQPYPLWIQGWSAYSPGCY